MKVEKKKGINTYEVGAEHIILHFGSGKSYLYTYDSCGCDRVDKMSILAMEGVGLHRYLLKHKPAHVK